MKILLLLLALLVPVQAYAFCDEWTTTHSILEGTFQAFTLIDWYTTLELTQGKPDQICAQSGDKYVCKNSSEVHEKNPILGSHPSRERVNTLIPLGMVTHAAISCFLPPEWRNPWQGITLILEINAVRNNLSAMTVIRF